MTAERDPYAFWEAMLAGETADLDRNEVVCGRFWKRAQSGDVIGISIDPSADGGFDVRIGKTTFFLVETAAQIEDFCEGTLSWICRQPVSHEDFVAWWGTGEWRDGALIDRKPPKPSRRKAAAPIVEAPPPVAATQDVPAAHSGLPGEPSAAPGIYVRTYACVDPCGAEEAFYARAIIRRAKGREGTSVGFYAESAEAARTKALGWVQSEREREASKAANLVAAAAKRKATTTASETGVSQ
jgi:hypothetical protein